METEMEEHIETNINLYEEYQYINIIKNYKKL